VYDKAHILKRAYLAFLRFETSALCTNDNRSGACLTIRGC
jgi:hypothetical protein